MQFDFFKKKVPLLRPEDEQELRNLKREAYMKAARELISQQAKELAESDIKLKPKDPYAPK